MPLGVAAQVVGSAATVVPRMAAPAAAVVGSEGVAAAAAASAAAFAAWAALAAEDADCQTVRDPGL